MNETNEECLKRLEKFNDGIDEMFDPNPEKPWLLKLEGDIEHDYTVKVAPYIISPDARTTESPRDPWEKHVRQICECGHLGGDHRPQCIVDGCSCVEMKGTGEWENRDKHS